jgi:hypothetical protein
MNKMTLSFILTSIAFFVLGYTISTFVGVKTLVDVNEQVSMKGMQLDDHATGELPHGHTKMNHEMIDLSESENQPTVDLIIHEDPKSGWNLQIVTTNFTFAPEYASQEHKEGQGHAHLYIDGTKITRLYGEWYHLPELTVGNHEIKVSLNANGHSEFMINGEAISDTEIIVVQ